MRSRDGIKRKAVSLISLGLIGMLIVRPPEAFAQLGAGVVVCANCSSEITQIANHAQLVLQYLQMAQQLHYQEEVIRMMTREGLNLSTVPNIAGMVMGDVIQIENLIQRTKGLSYGLAAADANFRATYPLYGVPFSTPYSMQYGNWATTTMNMALQLAKIAGAQQDAVMSEQPFNAAMQQLIATPEGMDQGIEITNALSSQMVSQMQQLRSLAAADMQSKAAYMGYQIAQQQATQQAVANTSMYVQRPGDPQQFGNAPSEGLPPAIP